MEKENYTCNVQVSRKVDNFKAEAVLPNGEIKEVSLEENMKNNKWTVLMFYPLDFTFVCPTEIVGMSESYETFKKEGAEIFGISTDSVHSHLAWCQKSVKDGGIGKINYPLIGDVNHEISKQFGVLIPEEGIAVRGLFVISPDGILEHATINNTNVGRNVDETLRILEALKSGGLCPINWHKGDKTL